MDFPICCVEVCKYAMTPNSDRMFYRLPLDNRALLDAWLNVMGCDESFVPTENSFICSSHFTIEDYVLENGIYEISQSAIPSKNLRCENSDINISTVTNGNNELNDYKPSTYNHSLNISIKQEDNFEPSPLPIIIDVQGSFPCNLNKETLCKNYNESESMNITNVSSIHNNSNFNIDDNNQMYDSSNIRISPKVTTARNTVLHKKDNQKTLNQKLLTNTNDIIVDTVNDKLNTSNYMDVPASIPLDSTKKPTFKINSTNSMISKSTNNISRGNKFNSDAWLTNSLDNYKYKLPNQFLKKLQLFARKNRRLVAKVKKLMTRNQDLLDTEIKYLELKAKVFETEEKLLKNGINTSEYSAFNIDNDNEETPKDIDIEYDVLVECKLNELNNKIFSNDNSMYQSTNYSSLDRNKNPM